MMTGLSNDKVGEDDFDEIRGVGDRVRGTENGKGEREVKDSDFSGGGSARSGEKSRQTSQSRFVYEVR